MENTTSPQMRGVGTMAGAMFILPMMDAIAKWLSTVDSLPPATVTLSRFVVQTVLTMLIIPPLLAIFLPKRESVAAAETVALREAAE